MTEEGRVQVFSQASPRVGEDSRGQPGWGWPETEGGAGGAGWGLGLEQAELGRPTGFCFING